jgi:hypothetical protein
MLPAAFAIPLITFTEYIEVAPATLLPQTEPTAPVVAHNTHNASTNYVGWILWTLYGIGTAYFAYRFAKSLFYFRSKIRSNIQVRLDGLHYVLLDECTVPHTFLNSIFLNKSDFESQSIPKEVLLHEATHVRQGHSWDLLAIELVHLFFWFNPLLFFIKRSMKLNHEFLADRAVLRQGTPTAKYQELLLRLSAPSSTPLLAHSIRYSSLKKRFTIMKTQTTTGTQWFRAFILIGLFASLILAFSSTKIVAQEAETMLNKAQVEEYNRLAEKYNNRPKAEFQIKTSEVSRMRYLYNLMTEDQRREAQPLPQLPPPPPAPPQATGAPAPPPAPAARPAPDPAQLLLELEKRGASFYMGPHEIGSKKAIEAVRKNPKINIRVDESNPLRPTVHLNDC